MKKFIALILTISIIGIILCSCNKNALKNLQGTYCIDTSIHPVSLFDCLYYDKYSKAEIEIKVDDKSNITYLLGESVGSVFLENEYLILTDNEQNTKIECIYKENYIIRKDLTFPIKEAEGTIPLNKWGNYNITTTFDNLNICYLEFFDDGHIEIELDVADTFCYYLEGTYTIKGNNLFDIKMEYAEFSSNSNETLNKRGECNTSIYIKDNKIYPTVYRKN